MVATVSTIVEYIIVSLLITHYLKMNNKILFICITTLLLAIASIVFDGLSIIMMALILCLVLFIFHRKLSNTILITAFLAASIPYVSQTFASLIISLVLSVTVEYASNLVVCDIVSKSLIIVLGVGMVYTKEKLTLLDQVEDWWALSLIFVDMISILYILIEMIVYQQINLDIMYVLVVLVLIMAALFIILLFLILQRNQELLTLEKTKLEVQNIQTVRTMYDTVLSTKHYIYYTLKKIQSLTQIYNNQELNTVLHESLDKTQQLRNVIYTGNPYFDYSFNEMLSTKSIMTEYLRIMILVKEEPILNNKEYVDVLLRLFSLFYEASLKDQPFDVMLTIKHGNLFFSMTGKSNETMIIDEKLKHILKQYHTTYQIHHIDDTFTFKAISLL